MASKILVVYVNYLGCSDLLRSLDSLFKYSSVRLNVVVVDNSPKDDCAALRERFPEVMLVRSNENLGFAGGCNLGVSSAASDWDYVLFFNPDAYCQVDFLTPLLAVAGADERWGALTPKIKADADGASNWYAGSYLKWWQGGPRHVYDDRFEGRGDVVEVPFASGCCSLIRRAAWDAAGPMDSAFFLYFEDTDLMERIRSKGYRIGYVPGTSVVHEESTTTGYQSPMFLYYFSRNRLLYLKRWAPFLPRLAYLFMHFFVKVPGAWVVFALRRRSPARAKGFTAGALDGMRGITGPNWRWHSSAPGTAPPE